MAILQLSFRYPRDWQQKEVLASWLQPTVAILQLSFRYKRLATDGGPGLLAPAQCGNTPTSLQLSKDSSSWRRSWPLCYSPLWQYSSLASGIQEVGNRWRSWPPGYSQLWQYSSLASGIHGNRRRSWPLAPAHCGNTPAYVPSGSQEVGDRRRSWPPGSSPLWQYSSLPSGSQEVGKRRRSWTPVSMAQATEAVQQLSFR